MRDDYEYGALWRRFPKGAAYFNAKEGMAMKEFWNVIQVRLRLSEDGWVTFWEIVTVCS